MRSRPSSRSKPSFWSAPAPLVLTAWVAFGAIPFKVREKGGQIWAEDPIAQSDRVLAISPAIIIAAIQHLISLKFTSQPHRVFSAVDAARSWISRCKSPFVVSVIGTGDARLRSAGHSEQSPWSQTTNVTRLPL